jgi:hypothetical protein
VAQPQRHGFHELGVAFLRGFVVSGVIGYPEEKEETVSEKSEQDGVRESLARVVVNGLALLWCLAFWAALIALIVAMVT